MTQMYISPVIVSYFNMY